MSLLNKTIKDMKELKTYKNNCEQCSFKKFNKCSLMETLCVHADQYDCECLLGYDYCESCACDDYEPFDKEVL